MPWRYIESPVFEGGWRSAFDQFNAWLGDDQLRSRRLLLCAGVVAVVTVLLISALVLSPSQSTLEHQLSG